MLNVFSVSAFSKPAASKQRFQAPISAPICQLCGSGLGVLFKRRMTMRFIAGVLFIFVFPYLLWKASVAFAVPYFGITNHPSLAAAGIIAIPALISLVIGLFCASGMKLPDN
jgi:hypothetical protein